MTPGALTTPMNNMTLGIQLVALKLLHYYNSQHAHKYKRYMGLMYVYPQNRAIGSIH